MVDHILFPCADCWWFYVAFTLFVFGVLAVGLGILHREAQAVTLREAAGWSIVRVALALAFRALFVAP
jgi:hypothetical protein